VPRWLSPALAFLILLPGPLHWGHARAADAPPGASSCSGCHAVAGTALTSIPPLRGAKAADIVAAMRKYKDPKGEAKGAGTAMARIARGFSDPEIEAIAAWFEAEK
jgi:cytochrome c553